MHADHSTEALWEHLRATRWNPPVAAASDKERRSTYVFALEQAEQMFRAAETVGSATQPLLVFYGLSQAGRAIGAAAARAGEAWRLAGHGIRATQLDGTLPDIEIGTDRPGSRGSFVRLSELLDSPLWCKERVSLNVLWNLLPENEQLPLLDTGRARRTPLWIDQRSLSPEPHPLASVPVVRFPPWVIEAEGGQEALVEYLSAFPEAQDYADFERTSGEPGANPAFTRHHDNWGELTMHWRLPDESLGSIAERHALLEKRTRVYDGVLYFFPSVTPTGRGLHPLMAWWSVLYALSMLARYQPAEWASHINVDTSEHAVAIERLLKQAIQTLPAIVAETIDQVSAATRPTRMHGAGTYS